MILHLVLIGAYVLDSTFATPSAISQRDQKVQSAKILASEVQLTVDVRSYLTKNDQNCKGKSDEGHNVPLKADAGDCWFYLDEDNNPLVTYSIYVTPVSEGDFNVTLYSDGHCKDMIGTVGPIAPEGLCIYSAVPAPQDCFRSYTFDPVNCECHFLNSIMWAESGVGLSFDTRDGRKGIDWMEVDICKEESSIV